MVNPSTPLYGDGFLFNDIAIRVMIPVPNPGQSGSIPKGVPANSHVNPVVAPTMIVQNAAVGWMRLHKTLISKITAKILLTCIDFKSNRNIEV